jgi:predicted GH43/DUF377 family glycosyl hydrolase
MTDHQRVFGPRAGWDSATVGIGGPPLWTEQGEVQHVVFGCATLFVDDELWIYYGWRGSGNRTSELFDGQSNGLFKKRISESFA